MFISFIQRNIKRLRDTLNKSGKESKRKFNKQRIFVFFILIVFVNMGLFLLNDPSDNTKDLISYPRDYVFLIIEGDKRTQIKEGMKIHIISESQNTLITNCYLTKELIDTPGFFEIAIPPQFYDRYFKILIKEKFILLPSSEHALLKNKSAIKGNSYEITY